MRILMLSQFYPPTTGGEERHVHDLSVELAARGHDVIVVMLWHEGLLAFECNQGVRIYRVRGLLPRMNVLFHDKERRHSPPFPDPEVLWALRRIILRERPDIVHAHNWIVHSFTPLKAWSKAKLVVSLHDCSFICSQKRFMYRGALCNGPGLLKCSECSADYYGAAKGVPTALAHWFWRNIERHTVDMFLPVSQAVAEVSQLAKYGVPYRVIPNFVPNDLDRSFSDSNSLLAQLPKDNYLLFVGDVTSDKGVEVLLQAYAETGSSVPLVLIGRLFIDISNLPPNVLALQSWPHDAVMSAFRRCLFSLLPSVWLEAFGIVVLEAMTMGKPVIVSRIGGLPEVVVDGETGLLVAPGDVTALRRALALLLDNPELRARMGTMAKQRVLEFEARTVIPRIEQVYQEVLQS